MRIALPGLLLVASLAACGLLVAPDSPEIAAGPSRASAEPARSSKPSFVVPVAPATPESDASVKPTAAALPAFIDIRRLDVEAADGQLSLSMTLAAAVPPGSPTVGLLAYRFYLDTDDDTAWNWYATFELVPEGGYVPVLVDRGGRRLEGPRYPGSAHVAGATITLTVPFESLGCPLTVGVRAAAEQTRGGATRQSLEPAATEPLRRVDAGC